MPLLLPCQYHLVSFTLPLLELLLSMLPLVFVSSFDCLEFLLLNLARLLHDLWKMSMALDSPYLGLLYIC